MYLKYLAKFSFFSSLRNKYLKYIIIYCIKCEKKIQLCISKTKRTHKLMNFNNKYIQLKIFKYKNKL